MASDDGTEGVTTGIQRSTEGVLKHAMCGFDGLVIFIAYSGHFLHDFLHTGSVVMIFLSLNLCFVDFQISLYALNSSVQMPVRSD